MPVSLMLRKMKHCTGSVLPTVLSINKKHYVLELYVQRNKIKHTSNHRDFNLKGYYNRY